MISYKTVNILLVFLTLMALVFYDDTQERDAKERSLYSVLYLLYLTHVCGLIFNVNTKLHMVIFLLGVITVITYLLSSKQMRFVYKAFAAMNEKISSMWATNTGLPMKKLNRSQKFDVSHMHRHYIVNFMIYLDVINNIKDNNKIRLLTLNQCPIIEYNSAQNTYDIVQYNCNSDQKYSVPIKYTKWTRFRVEFVKGVGNKPLFVGLQIDDDLVYSNKIYNLDNTIDVDDGDDGDDGDIVIHNITIGDNRIRNDSGIGFVKNILIGGA